MFWVWLIVTCLMFFVLLIRLTTSTISFFISSLIGLISYKIMNNFCLQLGIFIILGIGLSIFLKPFLIKWLDGRKNK